MVGAAVGTSVGTGVVGPAVGADVGSALGPAVGAEEGADDGADVGAFVTGTVSTTGMATRRVASPHIVAAVATTMNARPAVSAVPVGTEARMRAAVLGIDASSSPGVLPSADQYTLY
jgi:hypothetical protein